MTTRRSINSEKSILEKDDPTDSSPAAGDKSSIRPAVPTHVIVKLLGFTAAMLSFPIGTYFVTLNMLFKGNATFAGAAAAVMANVVLVAYIVVAMKEDQSEALEVEANERKERERKRV